jgi:ubiquitin-conjugating enzyme E2 Q
LDYLYRRIILQGPVPAAYQTGEEDTEEEDEHEDYADELFGINHSSNSAMTRDALRKDFKMIIKAGYRPGYTRISEFENVVSVAVKVSRLFRLPGRAVDQSTDARC